jgi:hypothetical protein
MTDQKKAVGGGGTAANPLAVVRPGDLKAVEPATKTGTSVIAADQLDRYYEKPITEWPLSERMRFCEFLSKSTSIPKDDRGNSANVYFKTERGARLGLSPTESLSHILVVNGATSVYGDMGLALVRKSGLLEKFEEWYEIDGVKQRGDDFDIIQAWKDGKTVKAFCVMKRRGDPERVTVFSIQDAIDGDLWEKKEGWRKSPKRMLMWRPRSFNMRDNFQDVLAGFYTVEEARDLPDPDQETATAIAAASQPDTKGAALVETLGGASDAMSQATKEEIEMLESILTAGNRAFRLAEIWRDLKLGKLAEITQVQAELYARALGLAIDEMNADQDRTKETGKLL